MIAGESLSFARLVDQVEVGLRQLVRLVVGIWTTSSIMVKMLIALAVLACFAAAGYEIYSLIVGG
jgi:hypothetical protein